MGSAHMEMLENFKKLLMHILSIFNIFRKDSLNNHIAIQKMIFDTIICFAFCFLITFSYKEDSQFKVSQLVINIFYPEYEHIEFCKIFNYFPLLFYSILINLSLSLLTTLVFAGYLVLDVGFNFIKSNQILIRIFCQSSKCLSLCSLVMFLILPISYITLLSNSLQTDLHLSANLSRAMIKPLILIYTISAVICLFALIRPLASLRANSVITHSRNSLFRFVDTNFHASLMLLLLMLGYLFMQIPDLFLRVSSNMRSSLINKTMLMNNYCNYLISSPYTPPAIKFGYKQVGCNRYVSCIEMPDDTTRNVCLTQLLLSSSDFVNISKYGQADYCKLPYIKPSIYFHG